MLNAFLISLCFLVVKRCGGICQNYWTQREEFGACVAQTERDKDSHSQRCWTVWFAPDCNSPLPEVQRYPGAPRPSCGCLPCSLFLLSGSVCHSCRHLHSPPTSGLLWPFSCISLPPLPHPCPHHSPPYRQTVWSGWSKCQAWGRD